MKTQTSLCFSGRNVVAGITSRITYPKQGKRINQVLARVVMERILCPQVLTSSDIVLHQDGNLLNITRENLRLVEKSLLRQRDPIRQNNSSCYRGVPYDQQ